MFSTPSPSSRSSFTVFPRVLLVLALLAPLAGFSGDEEKKEGATEPPPRVFLDKSPRIVAYQLRRLDDRQIVRVERRADHVKYRPVFEAFLMRPGLDRERWSEALAALSRINESSFVAEIVEAVGRNAGHAARAPVQTELAHLLVKQPTADLVAERARLGELAREAADTDARRVGFLGLARAGSAKDLWKMALEIEDGPEALLAAVPLMPADTEALEDLAGRVENILEGPKNTPLFPLALESVTRFGALIPGAADYLLSEFHRGEHREIAVTGLLEVGPENLDPESLDELITRLVEHAESVPAAGRTSDAFIDLVRLGRAVSLRLPAGRGRKIRARLGELGVPVIVIKTLPHQMLFDRSRIVAEAGKDIEIVLVNDDIMPHNLVLTTPGAREVVGQAAEKMPATPDAQGRLYVPELEQVLLASRMLEPDQRQKLTFRVPETPGEYPYVCTFPGHWTRMYGTLLVVEDLEAHLASAAASEEPARKTPWKLEELTGDLGKLSADRATRGRTVFVDAGCAQCHRVSGEGKSLGPDLDDVFERWKGDATRVLEEIIQPGLRVREGFGSFQVITTKGRTLGGLITREDDAGLTIQTGPNEDQAVTVPAGEILLKRAQGTSLMPRGLLDTLQRDQILDLMSFLKFPPPRTARNSPSPGEADARSGSRSRISCCSDGRCASRGLPLRGVPSSVRRSR